MRFMCIALSFAAAGCATHDRVFFNNQHPSGEIGILLDGNLDGTTVNDASFTTAADGHVDPGVVIDGGYNEVIAFDEQRPVTIIEGAGWSTSHDTITVNFPNEMGITVHVWLLQGPFADRQAQAIDACIKVDEIWERERMGVDITGFVIHDETANPDRTAFLDYSCAEAASMRSTIGFDTGSINMYYVNRVDFGTGLGTTKGVWCGNNTVVMGSGTSDHLAAHEIGHAFALDHINALTTNFDPTNVMHNASSSREFMTEGQTFRAHLDASSVINSTYNLRPGLITRSCSPLSETATDDCPAVQKRIWADGASWPKN